MKGDCERSGRHLVRRRHATLAGCAERPWLALARWSSRYGESPTHVVATSIGVLLAFGIAYPFVGGMRPTTSDAEPLAYDVVPTFVLSLPEWVEILGCVNLSVE